MLDFLMIATRIGKRGVIEVYPKFIVKKSSDLMIRGSDFYAIWVEERGLWSTDEADVLQLIDNELDKYARENREKIGSDAKVMHMWDAETGMIDRWHNYCKKQMRDNFHMLDEKLIFSNAETNKKDYASKRLSYPLEKGSYDAFDKLISTLYSEEERHKIEWAIGSIVSGESKNLQKFMVLYGAAGTGKSTILNIIQQLFEGYYSVFDARALGSSSDSFALEAFKTNPLVAIQHDGDLSRIEDNTRLNSLVSHELMTVNEKFKSTYSSRFKCFLFMGTNKPVKITDAKSGLIRRLIDVSPSGNKLSAREYKSTTKQVGFELGAIAYHCQEVYLKDPGYYDNYIPMSMLGASNDFYNFVIDSYHVFKKEDGTTLKAAWEMYKTYCDEAKIPYPFSQRNFKEELKNYFWDFKERVISDDGSRLRSFYSGFRTDKFEDQQESKPEEPSTHWIKFEQTKSIFDKVCADCPAQYASAKETPSKKWDEVTSKLSELDTSKLHYVKIPENHIIIDFDIKDENGNKSFEKNLEAASKWPPTYAELSKSGNGIHLHYIYSGDVQKLSRLYDEDIEIKVFLNTQKSALRRKLTKCNTLDIATISSGLPLKGADKMVNFEGVRSEKALRTQIMKCLNKEHHGATAPEVSFINKILDDAYSSGMCYDVTDLKNSVFAFAANSTHQSDICIKMVNKMKFKSEEPSISVDGDTPIVFYDVEVFPNLFLVNWKMEGKGKPVVRLINPAPTDIEELLHFRLIGFNCRRYDNHILYARLMGYTNEQLYNLSQKIISGSKNGFFGEAYNLSYTDVYDFAAKKQSLKKWEIELGIHHQELGLPWDQPVPEDMWVKVAEYCDNDVIATEAVFEHLKGDFTARKILAELAGMTVNDTTNSLTTRIIFGKERKPELVYTDLSETFPGYKFTTWREYYKKYPEYIPDDKKLYEERLSDNTIRNLYRGTDLGFGGYVYAEPGMYVLAALLDIASLHPHSIIAMNCFGKYTQHFKDILDARIFIKHGDFDSARKMLGGKLAPYLDDETTANDLAQALKIAINSVYGLTAANFDNPFRDIRNKNNIVALRGALFMRTLQDEVQSRGFTVAHIKTDSIKIPNATPEIINFCMEFAKKYGYTFEHEATYERMCLVNDAVYIAKYKDGKHAGEWTATGAQFQIPYVFKTLFSREPIEFEDMCETKSVSTSLYLDMNEKLPEDEHNYQFVGKVGLFCPIKPGCNGGELLREGKDKDGNLKYSSATGAKGYRWLESESVKILGKEKDIDRSYYNKLVDDAVDTISKYGDFEWFVSDEPLSRERELDTPPWTVACGKDTCEGCPNFINDQSNFKCRLGYDIRDMLAMNIDDNDDFKKR
jgi:energy-coupling factor transporter ATP-binding protein EcfA2